MRSSLSVRYSDVEITTFMIVFIATSNECCCCSDENPWQPACDPQHQDLVRHERGESQHQSHTNHSHRCGPGCAGLSYYGQSRSRSAVIQNKWPEAHNSQCSCGLPRAGGTVVFFTCFNPFYPSCAVYAFCLRPAVLQQFTQIHMCIKTSLKLPACGRNVVLTHSGSGCS